ncbi:MAG: 2-dehydropantoate 2-reductase N-terminal domain-containing protein, partial [Specibacter sp.]
MSYVDGIAPAKTVVLGAGSWGTTFAKILGDAAAGTDRKIVLWGRRQEVVDQINDHHRNPRYLSTTELPANISASIDAEEVLKDAQLVVLAVPAQTLREQLRGWAGHLAKDAVVVSLMKGLELGTDQRMSQVIAAELGLSPERIVVVSGPNLAMEIARQEPTASVVAC